MRRAADGDGSGPPHSLAAPGALAPRPGAAPLPRMLAAQARLEVRLLLRNGEQVLLTLVLPVLFLLLFATVDVIDVGTDPPVAFLAPGVLALAVMATAFTGQAIGTGFERRYGVLKRLGATPLPRWGLLVAKTAAVLALEAGQVLVLAAVALALGWDPQGSPLAALVLLVLGTAAFSGLGLLLAGTLRAEATLAVANLVYVLLLLAGGVFVPLGRYPEALRGLLELTPLAALAGGLREVLLAGAGLPWTSAAVLLVWAVGGIGAAAATFRWE